MMDDLLQEMIDPAPVHHDAPRRRRLWTTVAIVGLAAVGATTLTTSAIFTDNDTVSAEIQSGTVDLVVGSTTAFAFAPQNLNPGATTFAPLLVSSTGSLELRYAISYSAVPTAGPAGSPVVEDTDGTTAVATGANLANVLELRMFRVDAAADCNAANTAGTPLNAAGTVTPWPATTTELVGSPATLAQTGDRVLNAGTPSEWLCARVDFPSSAGNEYQDSGVELTLLFNAEQTANNT
ncbi:hypothetical protein [Cellulomonas sp. Root137]|uniref:hypothetical protein n=1 Tax=Cellulomonas sp. Root137 TaxID=1736459 RepID=UPI0006FE4800|nr:hypothetical protein [Cellulomonas sp. Root137]KQY47070.1 hypothetical protein ASD18_06745 [Cellulomonas sp. Root137]